MNFVLAPLAGFTDAPFRRMCRDGGADRVYTEMVSAAGLAHGSSPTRHLMETLPGDGPVALQLFGATESDLAAATALVGRTVLRRADCPVVELNLNAGCPMTKVTREGAGAKLIDDPAKIGRLLGAMKDNTDLPVTLKTRLGPHPQDVRIFEILDAAVSAGAAGLIVHARFTSQMHGGPTHLDLLRELVRRSPVPVTGNGSVTDAAQAAEMAETGVKAIMIGRAALSDPAIFASLKDPLRPPDRRTAADKAADCRRHLELILRFRAELAAAYPNDHVPGEDAYASVKMHTHLFRYFNGLPGAAKLRARLNSVRTVAEINGIINNYV